MTGSTHRSALAAALALCLACSAPVALASPGPDSGAAAAAASLHGRVIAADRGEPARDVVLALVAPDGETVHRSAPTGENGRFAVEVPSGRYAVLAETAAGAFLAADAVELAAGESTALSLTLQSAPQGARPRPRRTSR